MKQIFLIIFFIAGLMNVANYAQQKIPVTSGTAFFYADSISTTITMGKNEFLGQIWIESSRTATITPQVYNATSASWYLLDDDGDQYVITIADSSENYLIPLKPVRFYNVKTVRFVIDNDPADTLNLYFEKRPY